MSENNLKLYNIIYLPELPSNDDDIDHESTKIAIPSEEKENLNYTHGLMADGFVRV